MKTNKAFISLTCIIMSILMIMLSLAMPVGALSSVSTSDNLDKIDSALKEKMETAAGDEKIPVAIWYSDIDQKAVDKLTKDKVGFAKEDIAVSYEMPSTALLSDLKADRDGADAEMQAYLERTEKLREKERKRTDEYIMTRREFSRTKYNEKSAKVIKDTGISANDITFKSQYAPMILAELTVSQIEAYAYNNNIEVIYYDDSYDFLVVEDADELLEEDDSDGEALFISDNLSVVKETIRYTDVYDGLFENATNRPSIHIGVVEGGGLTQNVEELDSNRVIPVGSTSSYQEHPHITNVVRLINGSISGFSKNSTVYTATIKCSNIEALLSNTVNVSIMNMSYSKGHGVIEYSTFARWIDHLAAEHSITIVAAVYNSDNSGYIFAPATGYNVIAVGAYFLGEEETRYTNDLLDDYMTSYSGYINTGIIEKPDVIMPAECTSYATPILTSCISLMFELKPSLMAYPQATKAIVLASCHRKVNSSSNGEAEETILQGITEHQGAGAPDIWTMASIVCQGTYGVDTISSTSNQSVIRFVQPTYGASFMNVSLTWLRENTFDTSVSHNTETDVTLGDEVNLNLSVYRNGSVADTSELSKSSTEMAYFQISSGIHNYEMRINKLTSTNSDVRYGYAYSLNNSYMTPVTEEGIYYIKNYSTDTYLTLNTTTGDTYLNSFTGNDNQKWIVRETSTDTYELLPGYGTIAGKLNEGDAYYGVGNYAELGTDNMNLSLAMHGAFDTLNDGAVAFYYYDSNYEDYYFLNSIDDDPMFSLTYLSNIAESKTWRLEKINYRRGDVNMDGVFNIRDVNALNNAISQNNLNNMQKFLADTNYDGVINVRDVTKLQRVVGELDIY